MIKFDNPAAFNHHRSGWNYCKGLLEEYAGNSGVLCMNYADGFFGRGGEISEPWIGFFHNTPFHPEHCRDVYNVNAGKNGATTPLSKLIGLPNFRRGLKYCLGVFTLCNYCANYLKNHCDVAVDMIYHPTEPCNVKFDFNKFVSNPKVYTIGHWMRNFQSTYDLRSPYQKFILDIAGVLEKMPIERNDTVKVVPPVQNQKYDELLSGVVVFIDFFDVAACNTVIECIQRDTPIVTRRLPANEEYFGKDYPLFFDSLAEASSLLNEDKILMGHEYLQRMDKQHIGGEAFKYAFSCSQSLLKIKRRFRDLRLI